MLCAALALPTMGRSDVLQGDLTGDGSVDPNDEAIFTALYGAVAGDSTYDPAADLNGDGDIDVGDLARFGAAYGASGGEVDTTPPKLVVTLNDVPDAMNDLLVAPPDRFLVTVLADSDGGAVVDPSFLSVTASEDIGAFTAGSELAGQFDKSPTRFVWEVPAGSDMVRTSHYLTVSVRDAAGNVANQVYGFAVRDFPFGAPMGNPQLVFLDFDQDRSLTPEIDFLEDMRAYGLSSPTTPQLESDTRDELVAEIVSRVQQYYGYLPNGSPGPDPVDIQFVSTPPAGAHARICVGGQSSLGPLYLGSVSTDVNNLDEAQQECGPAGGSGVFPAAMDDLWFANPELHDSFDPLDPDEGGTPFGEDPLDAIISAPGFDVGSATPEEFARITVVLNALDAFAQSVATAIAHETGHTLGLTAQGPAPAGLFGGESGSTLDHNVTATGGIPVANRMMNPGGSFSFDEMTGRNGNPLPSFRPISWAYLHDRLVLSSQVTALFPPPTIASVLPNPAIYPNPYTSTGISIQGTGFLSSTSPPIVDLITEGDPTPNSVQNVVWVDGEHLTGTIHPALVPPALYDIRLINADGQVVLLPDGLLVQ